MKVNYIREMNAWMDFVLDEEPSANAQLLWHTLMALFNRRGEGDEWPEEIAISNQKTGTSPGSAGSVRAMRSCRFRQRRGRPHQSG